MFITEMTRRELRDLSAQPCSISTFEFGMPPPLGLKAI